MGNQASNLLGNIQQVQILTSSGQILTKATMADDKTGDNVKLSSPGLKVSSVGAAGVTALRNAIAGQVQMTIAKPQAGKNIKNVKVVTSQSPTTETTTKPVSLLTTSQQKTQIEKKDRPEQKLVMQKVAPQAGKVGTQLLNVSSVQLVSPRTNQGQIQTLTKPMLTKNNAPILTGVKLVNTQQGGEYFFFLVLK